ncbi:SHOCT domain-containing protein [Haloimpatiens sp. FM7330]|uniref:SHOCT domain-containing protein n=1 Tax=Haloimpatiens sp. FM7330 TaxID=3298610 RepID=UPI003641ABB4
MFRGCFGYGFSNVGTPYMFGFMIIRFLLIIGIVVIAVKLFKNYFISNNNAFKTLDNLYAKGEITEEEYKKRKSIIKNN